MNLLFAARGLSSRQRATAIRAMRVVARRYGHFPDDSVRSWLVGGLFLASATTDSAIAEPRRYVHESPAAVTMYSGVVLDPRNEIRAHDAGALESAWPTLPDRAEGRFVLARLDRSAEQLEILTDPLGVAQAYECRDGPAWMLSTSAAVLEMVAGLAEPDPVAVSMLLTTDWVWGDRTLRKGIRVIPGGSLIRAGADGVTRETTFGRAQLAALPQLPFDTPRAETLATQMTAMMRGLSDRVGSLWCPISAGKDTRVLVALTVAGSIPARYWTQGDADTTDVRLATELAARYRLPHRLANRPNSDRDSSATTTDVLADWDANVRRLLLRTDGLAPLSLIGNVAGMPANLDRIESTLSGLGGEIARNSPAAPSIFHARHSDAGVRRALVRHYIQHAAGLVRRESVELGRRTLEAWIDDARADGFGPADRASLFYSFERVRRWGGNNPREFEPGEDKVLLFCTRPFMRAAFSTPAPDRYTEVVHRGLLEVSVPSMLSDPGFDRPWRALPASPALGERMRGTLAGAVPDRLRPFLTRAAHAVRPPTVAPAELGIWRETDWLEARRGWIRDIALSQSGSAYWSYLDRRRFEFLLDERTPAHVRGRWVMPLLAAASLFVYDDLRAEEDRSS